MKTIAESALLVDLKVSQWGASKTDRLMSGTFTYEKHGEAGSYRIIKSLIPKRFLDPINSTTNSIRKLLHTYTFPWLHDGTGILPVTLHERFVTQYMKLEGQFTQQVDDLIDNMPTIRLAAAVSLGDGFDENEIPNDGAIRNMFRVRVRFMPISTEGDFRVDMSEDIIESIKEDFASELEDQVSNSIASVYARVVGLLESMIDGLDRHGVVQVGSTKASYFKEATIQNVCDLSDILDDLNIVDDPNLTTLSSDIRTKLTMFDAQDLRDDDNLRAEVKQDAARILQDAKAGAGKVGSFFGV